MPNRCRSPRPGSSSKSSTAPTAAPRSPCCRRVLRSLQGAGLDARSSRIALPGSPGLIRRMQFDRHTLVLLVRPPAAPELTDEEADELQDRHLAFRADLRDRGYLIGGGPL